MACRCSLREATTPHRFPEAKVLVGLKPNAAHLWASDYTMNPDGISYLDMRGRATAVARAATETMTHHLSAAEEQS
jgi:hypothetical protein